MQYAPRKETASEVVESFDFKRVIEKYIKPIILEKVDRKTVTNNKQPVRLIKLFKNIFSKTI